MNLRQISAIGVEIGKLQKNKEDLENEISERRQKIVLIDRDIGELSDGIDEARSEISKGEIRSDEQ